MQAANNEPSDEREHPTGEDDEAWVGLCVCGSLGSQLNSCAGHEEAIG